MINLNEIAFIDIDGFDYNDGECLIRFDTVAYYPDKNKLLLPLQNKAELAYSIIKCLKILTDTISNTDTLTKKYISTI